MDTSKSETICWACNNACTGGCSWSRDFVPVDGWCAVPDEIKLSGGNFKQTYTVISCPEFMPDKPITELDGGQTPLENLANAVVKLAVDDYKKTLHRKYRMKQLERETLAYDCEKFFDGKWIKILTAVDGSYIKHKIYDEWKQSRAKLKAALQEGGAVPTGKYYVYFPRFEMRHRRRRQHG